MLKRFFDWRREQCGDRLRKFKAQGGIVDSKLKFKKVGSYWLTWSSTLKPLEAVTHVATKAKVVLPPVLSSNITRAWQLDTNNLDQEACMYLPPLKPFLFSSLFEAGTGPHLTKSYKRQADRLGGEGERALHGMAG